MSLHTLANHLQSAGRGQDSVLVHMTPGEVKGLQALAMSQGGSLSINPQTGLPEAGILSSLLPMVAGFFLGPAGIGLTAMQSALAVGALGTAATGSLGKGFMMGLGAYGGAGLGQGLVTAGSTVAPSTAGNALASTADDVAAAGIKSSGQTMTGADVFAKQQAASFTPQTMTPLEKAGGIDAFKGYPQSAGDYIKSHSFNAAANPTNQAILNSPTFVTPAPAVPAVPTTPTFAGIQGTNINAMPELAGKIANPIEGAAGQTFYNTNAVGNVNAAGKINAAPSTFGRFDDVGRGFDKATSSWEGAKEVWNATPTGTGYGLAATGMSALQAQQEEAAEEAKAKADALAASRRGNIRPYEFSTELTENAFAPRESTAENRYFVEPRFIAQPIEKIAKEGGLMGYAVGGPVEEMSAENSIGGNMMYPQSQLKTDMYSNPMVQRPMPNNVIRSGLDAPVGTYTGEQRFAGGGSATAKATAPTTDTKYSYNPETMQYTQTTSAAPANSNNFSGNPFIDGMVGLFGVGPYAMGGNKGIGMGGFNPNGLMAKLNAQAAPQQTTTTQTMGGTMTPYMPPSGLAAADTSMIPNIPMQPQQDVNQQLGLEAFYPMMEQQLAVKGSQLQAQGYAEGGTANGGYSLGSYSDGGRLLRGPGDGVSDSIPASIGDRQPARLADGEFVVPARIVSEIGNGSTEAGARKLYAMMDRVQKARKKTVGKSKVAVNTRADKLLPA